ncbi:hypothetical protein SARC_11106 [Sphaeroforma arctica JP610]|uniref:Clathrin/coatomer adaptor adaptin-like N-terminal domain-containing protein n=1 Tax=Sphaeroforma arctica JP610 TaxID=667725 RepID=A0A0L0FHX6_9EUKA|nr:hypothetical protein SARC_11106 [Sphaeroforma arctica JP610]KNC76392.1 hypothetical protein SARC_11106 [Sphaeroforma arctica JP610]|eukprot:XP_014150294.1 hypothetical protein SARC_11106 [Sphaeroforma arctica JP610]
MIWIIGEYSDRIDNADELLENFVDGYLDELPSVQLQLLTAVVKLFLRRPQKAQKLVQQVLKTTTEEVQDPDLRDRGYIYWRLLSTDPAMAKRIVLAEKPLINDSQERTEPKLLEELTSTIGSLASVYHRHASEFVGKPRHKRSSGNRSKPETRINAQDMGDTVNSTTSMDKVAVQPTTPYNPTTLKSYNSITLKPYTHTTMSACACVRSHACGWGCSVVNR